MAVRRTALYVGLVVLSALWLLPLLIVVNGALKTPGEAGTFSLVPGWPPDFGNFADVWGETELGRLFFNSFVVSVVSTIVVVAVAALAGYGLAMHRFRGSGAILLLLLSAVMIAPPAVIVPLYRLIVDYDLLNNYAGLIGPYSAFGLSVGVLLYRSAFLTLPQETFDAARVDGASPFRTFVRIAFPLVKPMTATVAILQFLAAWNDYILALLFMTDVDKQTAQLAFVTYSAQYLFSQEKQFAVMTLVMVPVVVVFVVFQRWFIRGLTGGAVR